MELEGPTNKELKQKRARYTMTKGCGEGGKEESSTGISLPMDASFARVRVGEEQPQRVLDC